MLCNGVVLFFDITAILAYAITVMNMKIKTITNMKKYHVKLCKFIRLFLYWKCKVFFRILKGDIESTIKNEEIFLVHVLRVVFV